MRCLTYTPKHRYSTYDTEILLQDGLNSVRRVVTVANYHYFRSEVPHNAYQENQLEGDDNLAPVLGIPTFSRRDPPHLR